MWRNVTQSFKSAEATFSISRTGYRTCLLSFLFSAFFGLGELLKGMTGIQIKRRPQGKSHASYRAGRCTETHTTRTTIFSLGWSRLDLGFTSWVLSYACLQPVCTPSAPPLLLQARLETLGTKRVAGLNKKPWTNSFFPCNLTAVGESVISYWEPLIRAKKTVPTDCFLITKPKT